jgi:uncharacterized protein YjbI with pentapeptide repeats
MDTKMIGGKIAKARKEKNMSQAQLAQVLFISPQAVGKWERGESIPDIVTFNRMAEILGVDLNYFSENFQPVAGEASLKMKAYSDENVEKRGKEIDNELQKQGLLTNFSGSSLSGSDFAGIAAHNMKFNGTALSGADFRDADLTGSTFSGSDMTKVNFDGANLTNCRFSANTLSDASFNKAILIRTEFNASGLDNAKFSNAELVNVKLVNTDLRKTVFENCVFNNVDFKNSDLRGACLNEQTFIGVKFHNAALNETTFKGATLKNVSFRSTYALTNKYYRAIKTICFDEAKMDKLTYATLKGLGADLSKVTTI